MEKGRVCVHDTQCHWDTKAEIMKEVCFEIKIEPDMLPVGIVNMIGNNANNARLDIPAREVWRSQERTFFYVRVTHPTAASHLKNSMEALYRENENKKKRAYNDRVINIEKGAFKLLVFCTTSGMGTECTQLNKQLAEMISQETGKAYAHVMRHLRTIQIFIVESNLDSCERVQRTERPK